MAAEAAAAAAAARAPFEWVDGPLVTAMRRGDIILIDELNLAEDAVLERLNRCRWPCLLGPDADAASTCLRQHADVRKVYEDKMPWSVNLLGKCVNSTVAGLHAHS